MHNFLEILQVSDICTHPSKQQYKRTSSKELPTENLQMSFCKLCEEERLGRLRLTSFELKFKKVS